MANIARDIFKAYDIRGIVGKTLTDEAAYLIGKAIATKASEKGITRIALGRDGRLSGPGLMAQIQRGFTDSGIDVLNVGILSSYHLMNFCYSTLKNSDFVLFSMTISLFKRQLYVNDTYYKTKTIFKRTGTSFKPSGHAGWQRFN